MFHYQQQTLSSTSSQQAVQYTGATAGMHQKLFELHKQIAVRDTFWPFDPCQNRQYEMTKTCSVPTENPLCPL